MFYRGEHRFLLDAKKDLRGKLDWRSGLSVVIFNS